MISAAARGHRVLKACSGGKRVREIKSKTTREKRMLTVLAVLLRIKEQAPIKAVTKARSSK